jgi:hypothetical protein
MRPRPTRLLLSAPLALGILALTATAAPAYHSHVEHSLHELRRAHAEIKAAKHNFGGHRRAALKDIDAATHQLNRLVGHPHHKHHAGASGYRAGSLKHRSHIHHALHELREARGELERSRFDFGGHKLKAIKDINAAIRQLEIIVRHYR